MKDLEEEVEQLREVMEFGICDEKQNDCQSAHDEEEEMSDSKDEEVCCYCKSCESQLGIFPIWSSKMVPQRYYPHFRDYRYRTCNPSTQYDVVLCFQIKSPVSILCKGWSVGEKMVCIYTY